MDKKFDVHFWRAKFTEIRKKLPKDWKKRLVKVEPSLDSLEGASILTQVGKGRASIHSTKFVVEALERMMKENV